MVLIPGLVSITFRELPPEAIIEAVAQNRLQSLEWGGDVHVPHGDVKRAQEVGERTVNHGLVVAAYGSYYRFRDVVEMTSTSSGPSWSSVLETAHALGAPLIRVWAGTRGSGETDPQTRQTIVERSRNIADDARRFGIQIAFEYHGGTLTDTNESAQTLLKEISHENVRVLWQPPNGAAYEYCVDGLRGVRDSLANVHCFHWGPAGGSDKRPLREGAERWHAYLREIVDTTRADEERHILIEFVYDGTLNAFAHDARTLRSWLAQL